MPSGGEVPRPGATESSVFTAPGIFAFTLLLAMSARPDLWLMGWMLVVSSLVYIFDLQYIPFAGGIHAYVWKGR